MPDQTDQEPQNDPETPPKEPQATQNPPADQADPVEALVNELAAERARTAQLTAALETSHTERAQALAEHDERIAALTQAHLAAIHRALLAESAGQVVAELIRGDTPEALEASVTTAREAYTRIADQLRAQAATQVPVGASAASGQTPEELSPIQKITQALTRNNR